MKNKENDKQDASNKRTTGRRKLLKSMIAGGGAATVAKVMPEQWARPVVDNVMLPSHAQTTFSAFGPFVSSGSFGSLEPSTMMAEQGFSEELLEFFSPAAQAGVFPDPDYFSLTANASGNSFLCATAKATTEMTTVQIKNTTPPSFTADPKTCLYSRNILSGKFVEGTGWLVTVFTYEPCGTNVTTDITLSPGGPGCTGGVEGTCGFPTKPCLPG